MLLCYVLYRFIFNFVVPIYKTTSRVKQGIREMNEKMRQHGQATAQPTPEPQFKTQENKTGEYIDFEEVKE